MVDRETALRRLTVGDIFHGQGPNGGNLICVVTHLTERRIGARRITTQEDLEFDRQTGVDLADRASRIDCVAPLPGDINDVFLDLDGKYQRFREMRRIGIEPGTGAYKLTSAERRALLFIDEHVSSNPI
jgi:hypothetical protein